MQLQQSTKRLLIILGAVIVIYGLIQVYYAMQRNSEEKEYAAMMEEIYQANPGLKEELAQQEEMLRLYGPRALEMGFTPESTQNILRRTEKLDGGFEKIIIYYQEDQPKEEYVVKDGELNGLFRSWNPAGVITEESEYVDNVLNGVQKSFYSNGNIKSETTFIEGKKQGPSSIWYQNGKQSNEVLFHDDIVVSSTSFYPDGSVRLTEKLNEDTGVLFTQAWYTNGELSHEFSTIHGKREGTLIKNAPTGFKVAEASYKDGLNDGWCRVWNEDGELDIELKYDNGVLDRAASTKGRRCDIDIWRFGFR